MNEIKRFGAAACVHVDLESVLRMMKSTTYTEKPPRAVCLMEMGAAIAADFARFHKQKWWCDRWHCGRAFVRNIQSEAAKAQASE